jgi:hypothetical protein
MRYVFIWVIHIRFHHIHDYCLKFFGLFVHLLNHNRHYHFHRVPILFFIIIETCQQLHNIVIFM